MGKLLEIKKTLELNKLVEIDKTDIVVSVFNFSTGVCDRHDFSVTFSNEQMRPIFLSLLQSNCTLSEGGVVVEGARHFIEAVVAYGF